MATFYFIYNSSLCGVGRTVAPIRPSSYDLSGSLVLEAHDRIPTMNLNIKTLFHWTFTKHFKKRVDWCANSLFLIGIYKKRCRSYQDYLPVLVVSHHKQGVRQRRTVRHAPHGVSSKLEWTWEFVNRLAVNVGHKNFSDKRNERKLDQRCRSREMYDTAKALKQTVQTSRPLTIGTCYVEHD